MAVIKLQKVAEDSQNKKKCKQPFWVYYAKTQLAFFPGSWNKQDILDSY